jgi:DNA-binding SARP family transcriptional activator/Tfp pilus assembly protein PilF
VGVRTLRDVEHGRVDHPRNRSVDRLVAALELSGADRARLRAAGGAAPSADSVGGLRVGVLGPLSMRSGGMPVELSGSGLRCLLGLLALQPGRVVSREEITEVLWATSTPKGHANQIRVYVNRLRRLLEPDSDRRTGFGVLVRAGEGYRLDLDRDGLDLLEFDDLVAQAGRAAADGQAVTAHRLLGQALRCWRGPVVGGVEPRLAQHPAAIAAAGSRAEAALAYAEVAEEAGGLPQAAGQLRRVAIDEPLHEGVHARLMLALAAAGQQAAALEVFEAVRRRLDEELGIEPGTELRAAQARVLRQQVPVEAPGAGGHGARNGQGGDGPVANPRWVRPAQLPAAVAGFTGRAEELARLDAVLVRDLSPATTIVAVDGTAGVGKTALAVHWAHRVRDRFADGQLYVDLRGYATGDPLRPIDALAGFLRALGTPAEQVPVQVEDAAGMYRSLLADRRVLVLLDNARDAEHVRPLLPGTPGCLALVTSRVRLTGLVARDGATRVSVGVLTADGAGALLAHLLGVDRSTAEPVAVADLAQACAYLPLALRIAAANVLDRADQSVTGYLDDLTVGDRLTALEVDDQAAVRTAFALSHARLDPSAQRLFRLLGAVPGSDVTVEAAAALAGTSSTRARDLLNILIRAHLLDEHAPGRYTTHDLLRRYAAELAQRHDNDLEQALQRLYDHQLSTVDAAAGLLYPQSLRLPVPVARSGARPVAFADEGAALDWLDAERSNLLAIVTHTAEHGPRPVAWRLADALRGYLNLRMHTVDWLAAAHAAASAAVAGGDPQARAAAELNLATYHWYRGHYPRAIEHETRFLDLAHRVGWIDGQAAGLANLGALYAMIGRLEQSTENLVEGLSLKRRTGDVAGQAIGLNNLGFVRYQQGRLHRAGDDHTRALELCRHIGSRSGQADSLAHLGMVRHLVGHLDRAVDHLTEALGLHREIGDRVGEAGTLASLAAVHIDAGRPDHAVDLAGAALALARDIGSRPEEASALIVSATVDHRLGRHRQALDACRHAARIARDIGYRYLEAQALIGLAQTLAGIGEPHLAPTRARHALTLARTAGFRLLEGQALTTVAAVDHDLGNHRRAADQARRALTVHRETSHRLGAARTHVLLGRSLGHLDDGDAARGHWRQALTLFTDVGTPEADLVHRLLTPYGSDRAVGTGGPVSDMTFP